MLAEIRYAVVTVALLVNCWAGAEPAQAVLVTRLDITGGSVEFEGRAARGLRLPERILDRLFNQEGTLLMLQYQPLPEIVSPVNVGPRTVTLFTSGVHGASAPWGMVDGSTIVVDLASLFLGISSRSHLTAINIGGIATGSFNPDTSAFTVSWSHVFGDYSCSPAAHFTWEGRAVLGEVPLPATAALFATGMVCLLSRRVRHWLW